MDGDDPFKDDAAATGGVSRLISDNIRQATGESGLLRVRVYHSAEYQTDLALSFTWETN